MNRLLTARVAIYNHFQQSVAAKKHFFASKNRDAYAAYYTSMYLLQDTGEALYVHLQRGFSKDPLLAYIEFWGVMQATQIQQDALRELYRAVSGIGRERRVRPAWLKLRDFRNLVAGHPAKRTFHGGGPQRAFMGRGFGTYDAFTYEVWDLDVAMQANSGGAIFPGVTHPVVNLRHMFAAYEAEAVIMLQVILNYMRKRWP